MDYTKIYNSLISKAKERNLKGYKEKHHIIPRCMGGTNSVQNIVELTPEEHYVAHQLLTKIYPIHGGLALAAVKMCQGRSSNKLYGWLRRKMGVFMSKRQSGSGNSTYNTMWISNGIENKMILKSEDIPDGWKKGRKIKSAKIRECDFCKKTYEVKTKEKYCSTKCRTDKRQQGTAAPKSMAEALFEEFKNSEFTSINQFAKLKNTSQPRLTMLWKKYVPEYLEKRHHGKSFLK